MAVGGMINWNEDELRELLRSEQGPVAKKLLADGQKVTKEAKRLAPTSPHGSNGRPSGWLRSHIGFNIDSDEQGLYCDVYSPAATPEGDPYGLFQEIGTYKMKAQPYLRPALDVLR